MDWSLIDYVTWPVFLVQYLMMMGYIDGLEWKGFYIDALQRDYYDLFADRKLMVLHILCDDVLDSAELRAEIDMREESEVGIDSDGVMFVASEVGARKAHPRYSKTSACQDQEAMGIVIDRLKTNSSCNSSYLSYKSTVTDADVNQDGNGDECRLCGMDGTLLCCDGYPSAYHLRCIGVSKMFIPEREWYCPECTINKIGPTITRELKLMARDKCLTSAYSRLLPLKLHINFVCVGAEIGEEFLSPSFFGVDFIIDQWALCWLLFLFDKDIRISENPATEPGKRRHLKIHFDCSFRKSSNFERE